MTRKLPIFSIFALNICFLSGYSSTAMSSIYKWVDEDGKVHYGQQRPASADAEKMKINSHAPRDTSSYKRPSLNKENTEDIGKTKDKDKNTTEEAPKVESAADKKRRLEACAQARKQLATMQAKGQIRSRDKDGNITYMSQEQKEARMKSIREAVAQKCK